MPKVQTKRRRITKACDFCHRRGRKCKSLYASSPDAEHLEGGPQPCLTCLEHDVPCTWDRVSVKRGVKSRPDTATADNEAQRWVHDTTRHGPRVVTTALILTFFDTVYPIFPFFDQDEILLEWENSSLSSSRAAFSRLMALCALSSCHIKNGAILGARDPVLASFEESAVYLEDAQSAIPHAIQDQDIFDYLQAISTLVLVAIQIGDASLLHQYLGLYHTLTAKHALHDESRWPATIGLAERETRKRLFWSMYRIEVHSALVMGHSIRCPEMHAAVSYPLTSIYSSASGLGTEHNSAEAWLIGWNYVTDLYRVLEYVIIRFRSKRMRTIARGDLHDLSTSALVSTDSLISQVIQKQRSLPTFLTRASAPSSQVIENRCGFQVANIVCTMQLLKTLSFACEDVTFADACTAAQQLIEEFSTIPLAYIRAIGSPMRQELAGVGHLLSSFIGRPLLYTEYQQLRTVILSMVAFLESLGATSPSASAAGLQLSQHIERIDSFIAKSQDQQPLPDLGILEHESGNFAAITLSPVFQASATGNDLDLVVPMEYLQHIPWPGMLEIDMNWPELGMDSLDN